MGSPACLLHILRQDLGQDVEPYFQEVLAALEQSAEEGSRGEGGALRGRLLQLYSEIVGETDAGKEEDAVKVVHFSPEHPLWFVCTYNEFIVCKSASSSSHTEFKQEKEIGDGGN